MLSAYQANLAAFMVGKLAPGALIDKFTDIGQLPGGKVCLLEAISRCVLHSVTVCCSALQCVVLCGSALQCVAQYWNVCVLEAIFGNVLQSVAVCCSVMQNVEMCACWRPFQWVCCRMLFIYSNMYIYSSCPGVKCASWMLFLDICSVLQRVAECSRVLQRVTKCCSLLQRVAACCSVLQRVAACCSWQSCLLKAKVTRYIHLSYLSRIYIHICIIHTISRYMHIHIIQIHMCVSVYKNTSYVTYEGIMPHLYEPCHTALWCCYMATKHDQRRWWMSWHIWKSHVTHIKESCHVWTCEWAVLRTNLWMGHVTQFRDVVLWLEQG